RDGIPLLVQDLTTEDPVPVSTGLEVLLLDPLPALVRMAFPAPTPQHLIDTVVHESEGAFARSISVIQRPAFDLLIQTQDEYPGCLMPRVVQGCPDLAQECLHARFRWFQQHGTIAVAANRLSQEVEAVLDMRDSGFLVGEFE